MTAGRQYRVELSGQTHDVAVLGLSADTIELEVAGQRHLVRVTRAISQPLASASASHPSAATIPATPPLSPARHSAVSSGDGIVKAPMPGILVGILVSVGSEVAAGQTVAVIEAMKMENNIPAPRSGKISAIQGQAGKEVEIGQPLLTIV